jgi:hypothetical protein
MILVPLRDIVCVVEFPYGNNGSNEMNLFAFGWSGEIAWATSRFPALIISHFVLCFESNRMTSTLCGESSLVKCNCPPLHRSSQPINVARRLAYFIFFPHRRHFSLSICHFLIGCVDPIKAYWLIDSFDWFIRLIQSIDSFFHSAKMSQHPFLHFLS